MSTIKVSDLQPTGYDLLSDSESYLRELSEEELNIAGGLPTPIWVITFITPFLPSHDGTSPKKTDPRPETPDGGAPDAPRDGGY